MLCQCSNTVRMRGRRRRGTVLIWCGLALPALVGMVGLVIDGGLMMATYRQAQNAADAAALVGANALLRGLGNVKATSDANTLLSNYNVTSGTYAPSSGTGTINIPPVLTASYSGSANYVEAVVSLPLTTYFIQVLPGISQSQSVTAHAVAGYESYSADAGVMVLASTGNGLTVEGSSTLLIPGNVVVNSSMQPTGSKKNTTAAVDVTGASQIKAYAVNIMGGDYVESSSAITNYTTGGPNPVQTGALPTPDPFDNGMYQLPTPSTANGVVATTHNNTSISSGTTTLSPGIYNGGISISRAANVTLNPGIYVLQGGGLSIAGNATVNGSGVMFYNTGSNYPSTGTNPTDNSDLSTVDPYNQNPLAEAPGDGGVSIGNSVTVNVTPYNSSGSPFNGILIYQRRANTQKISMSGSFSGLTGLIYAKWAEVDISASAANGAQIIANNIDISGSATITIKYSNTSKGPVPAVYLVD